MLSVTIIFTFLIIIIIIIIKKSRVTTNDAPKSHDASITYVVGECYGLAECSVVQFYNDGVVGRPAASATPQPQSHLNINLQRAAELTLTPSTDHNRYRSIAPDSSLNKCIGDDTKAVARQSPICI